MSLTPKYCIRSQHDSCAAHGEYQNHLVERFGAEPGWLGCPRCHFDARHSADEGVHAAAQQRQARRELNQRLLDSDIPRRYHGKTLANFTAGEAPAEQANALAACTEYANNFVANFRAGRCLLLLGTVGTGKTHLGCAVLQHVVREHAADGVFGRYVTASGIIRDVKATFGKAGRTEGDIYRELTKPNLLVLDEVGLQHGTDFERQVMFEVINARYELVLPTLLISNLDVAGLRGCLGDRVADRLNEPAAEVVLFRWDSARGAE